MARYLIDVEPLKTLETTHLMNTPMSTDLREAGRNENGDTVYSDRRLYFQFHAYSECRDIQPIIDFLETSGLETVLYEDACDPLGIGIVWVGEKPEELVGTWRTLLQDLQFEYLDRDPEMTMTGRTYSLGYETDLDHVLLRRPRKRLADDALSWTVWYPLRRSGAFEQLEAKDQRAALMEHGRIGSAFGEAGLAQDIRLACHGLDRNDNDFVIGLLGTELHPLSAVVQTMRKTVQTSQYIEQLGPFFVGHKVWCSEALQSAARGA